MPVSARRIDKRRSDVADCQRRHDQVITMNRTIGTSSLGCCFVTGIATAILQRCAAAEPATISGDRSSKDPVVIVLRSSVQTDLRVIRLVDVANITGGDSATRERIKQLDLEDGVSAGESLTILPPQIEFRMRIAGIDVERVSIKGSGVRVTSARYDRVTAARSRL